jgi:hypothetical protein
MARLKKIEISGNFDSVVNEINYFLKELNSMYSSAKRDYNEIKRNTTDNPDRITLEAIRANTLKSVENYFKIRLDTLKLLAIVADKMSPKDKKEITGKLSAEERNSVDMDSILEEMKAKYKRG